MTVKISGENISEMESYIGNIEPGKSGNVDMLVTAQHLSEGTQRMNYITIVYEDRQGNKQEKQEKLEQLLNPDNDITAPVYKNLEKVKEEEKKTGAGRLILVVGIVVVVIAMVSLLGYRKWKRKQRIQEEF